MFLFICLFALQAHEPVRNNRLYEDFSMGKCSWILVMAQLLFHQHHTEFHCKAKVSDFLLEMHIKKLAQKTMSLIRKSFLPDSFLTSFSSSALLFSHFFHVPNPCSLYKTQVKFTTSSLKQSLAKPCLPPWGHHAILGVPLIHGAWLHQHLHLCIVVTSCSFSIFVSSALSRATQ